MRVTWKHGDRSIKFERQPMPPERFAVLCKLAGAAIGGLVLVALVRMVGTWAIVWAVGVVLIVGFGKLLVWLCKSIE